MKKTEAKTENSSPATKALETINEKKEAPIEKVEAVIEKKPPVVISKDVEPMVDRPRKKRAYNKKPVQIIDGQTLLFFTDVIIPRMLSLANNAIVKDETKKVKWQDLALEPSEKKQLKKIADEAAKEIGVNLGPIETFAISVGMIYGTKMLVK